MKRSIALCVALAIATEALFIWDLYRQVGMLQEDQSASNSRQMLSEAITHLNLELVTDAATGRRTIPGVGLVFPPSDDTFHLRYRVASSPGLTYLSDSNNLDQALGQMRNRNTLPEIYRQVGPAQACTRQVIIALGGTKLEDFGNNEKFTQILAKQLKDGRSAIIYHNEACPYPADALLDIAKQVDSR